MWSRREFLGASLGAACVLPTWAAQAQNAQVQNAQAQNAPARVGRILMVTQSAGFRHGSVTRRDGNPAPAEVALSQLGVSSGVFRVETTQDVARDFTRERLDAHDIVFFYTTGDLPIPRETLEYFLNDWVKQPGKGFVGTHSATDTFKEYAPYYDMIGGTFDGHPWGAGSRVTISVHDQNHPASKPWGAEFSIQDEIYQFRHWAPQNVRVLMSLNMARCELKRPRHVPIAWVKEYGRGKVFYLSLGHREDVWTNEKYQASLLGGINWILGNEPGDATPNPELSAEEERKARAAAEAAGAQN